MNIENLKLQSSIFRCSTDENSTLFLQESEGEKEASLSSRVNSSLVVTLFCSHFNWDLGLIIFLCTCEGGLFAVGRCDSAVF